MFRDKNFLIEKGMYPKNRSDVYWLVGTYYDDFVEKRVFNKEEVEKSRKYLDDHRELIDNLDKSISIAQTDTILKKLEELYRKAYPNKEDRTRLNKQSNNIKGYGVYGIYINNELVYIGETMRSFEERFKEHKLNLRKNEEYKYIELNKAKNGGAKISLIPLIDVEKLLEECEGKRTFSEKEVKCMELALIKMYQPKLNIEGRLKKYHF